MKTFILLDHYDYGCVGNPIGSNYEAVKKDCYSIFPEPKIKLAFRFHNGTMSDLKRFAKDNHCTIVTEKQFLKYVNAIPDAKERELHLNFLEQTKQRYL